VVPAGSFAHGLSCSRRLSPLSGRNSTYRTVQISGTGSDGLFDELHQLEADSQPSERRVRCDSERHRLLGNIGRMLQQLRSLLGRPDVAKGPVRRLISNWHLEQLSDANNIEMKHVREAVALSLENLSDNPGSINDLRNWLRAYRMMPDFTFSNAIDRTTRASLVSDSIEPLYYLMVINFMAYRTGIESGLSEAKKYLELCKRKASALVSKKSYEWISAKKQSALYNWPITLNLVVGRRRTISFRSGTCWKRWMVELMRFDPRRQGQLS
jgi:hypothetical protein